LLLSSTKVEKILERDKIGDMKMVVFGLLIICALSSAHVAAQCSCSPRLSVQEHFQRAHSVFVGKVIEATKIDANDVLIKLEVKQAWKRDMGRFVIVKESFGSTAGFDPGSNWLLYTFTDPDGTLKISRGCCSRTRLLATANSSGDLKMFKKLGEKPKNITDTGSLSR
jgi:hypothetical protein